jgi:hypothetical protein
MPEFEETANETKIDQLERSNNASLPKEQRGNTFLMILSDCLGGLGTYDRLG